MERSQRAAGAMSRRDQPQVRLAERHAAAAKQRKIAIENTSGITKKYLKLRIAKAPKQVTSAHAVPRISASVPAGTPPSCQAKIAENTRKTVTKSPKPT
jgi:hypothetical protein